MLKEVQEDKTRITVLQSDFVATLDVICVQYDGEEAYTPHPKSSGMMRLQGRPKWRNWAQVVGISYRFKNNQRLTSQ